MADGREDRWSRPVPLWNVRGGRLVGDPIPANHTAEARIIRHLNERETSNGRERFPDTEWAYKKPSRPPSTPMGT
ncbi:MAG: hypothetical protein OXI45_10955 [Acidobacteriota bacterium]|nr:hypothetical protein [Acidobacteriota bacterium]